jgi:hypothetical protein
LVKITKYLVYALLIFFFTDKAYSIESAAHKVEVSKCFGILMTIQNNSLDDVNRIKAKNILNLYLDKIIRLNIGSLMMKEMSELGAKSIYLDVINTNTEKINKSIQKCINFFKIG